MADSVEIVIDGPAALRHAQRSIATAARAYWARNQPLRVVISSDDKPNTSAQKRYWNGPILTAIAEQARWNGRQFPKEFWKEYYRRRFLLRDDFVTPDGEVLERYWSTADASFSVRMMTDFLDKVRAEAATDWGVVFDV